MPPEYVLPEQTKPSEIGGDTAKSISKANDIMTKANELINNGTKLFETVLAIMDRRKSQEQVNLSDSEINAKAQKIANRDFQNNSPDFSTEPSIIKIPATIKPKTIEAVDNIFLMVKSLDKKKTIESYIQELEQMKEAGMLDVAVKEFLIKFTEVEYKQ